MSISNMSEIKIGSLIGYGPGRVAIVLELIDTISYRSHEIRVEWLTDDWLAREHPILDFTWVKKYCELLNK